MPYDNPVKTYRQHCNGRKHRNKTAWLSTQHERDLTATTFALLDHAFPKEVVGKIVSLLALSN